MITGELLSPTVADAATGILHTAATIDVDRVEQIMLDTLPPVDCPLKHIFTPGLYTRQIFIPKDTLITSREHITEHPFVVISGDISVFSDNEQSQRYVAPHVGVTLPGTRRVLFAHEDTIWITFHATDLTKPDEIVEAVTAPYCNKYLGGDDPRLQLWREVKTPQILEESK